MKKILVVDDSGFTRDIHKAILVSNGFAVIEAGSGKTALELFDRERPDGVIMDLLMEDMDGMDVSREILERDPGAVIIVCSTDKQKFRRKEARQIGCKAFLPKPLDREELIETLNHHLSGQIK